MKKLISNGELFAILLFGVIALIMGGWSIGILTILIGALIGFMVTADRLAWRRALLVGLFGSLVIALATLVFNKVITLLPKVGEVPAAAAQPIVFIISIALGTLTAGLIAYLRSQPNEKLRRYGLLALVTVFAVAFPFYEQDTKLLWLNAVIVAMIYTQQALGLISWLERTSRPTMRPF